MLGNCSGPTWKRHHPGIDSLHLSAEVAAAWKQRLRTKTKTVTTADGAKTVIETERICHRECLTPVRAFYLDLAQWAVEDPGPVGAVGRALPGRPPRNQPGARSSGTASRGWTPAPGTAPGPAGPGPLPPPAQHADAAALLQAARARRPGDVIHRRRADAGPLRRRQRLRQASGPKTRPPASGGT